MSRSENFPQLVQAAKQELQLNTGRRRFFVTAMVAGATSAFPALSQAAARSLPSARLTIGDAGRGPSRFDPPIVKDVGLLSDLNKTNQSGAWWNFDSYIPPVSQFYIRHAFP